MTKIISPQTLLSINAGLMKTTAEPVVNPIVDFDDVLSEVQTRSESGELSQTIANGKMKYQATVTRPALLEQVKPDGTVTVGMFTAGEFVIDVKSD
jgi:hypothetical protein